MQYNPKSVEGSYEIRPIFKQSKKLKEYSSVYLFDII